MNGISEMDYKLHKHYKILKTEDFSDTIFIVAKYDCSIFMNEIINNKNYCWADHTLIKVNIDLECHDVKDWIVFLVENIDKNIGLYNPIYNITKKKWYI